MSSSRQRQQPPAYTMSAGTPSDPNLSALLQQQVAGPEGIDGPPPPQYSEIYGEVAVHQDGVDTHANITDDGRIDININQQDTKLTALLAPALLTQWRAMGEKASEPDPDLPPGAVPGFAINVPPMNIVIQIIGSRGDVQPFVALGQVLKLKYGHRVRIATHPTFQGFVEENGLEFFSLGGDPKELMAFMVKNPGLMPKLDAAMLSEVQKRRKSMWEMLVGGWRSCIEPGNGIGFAPTMSSTQRPFVADAIIANPPSYGHIHYAEKLGIPLHLMFTMPWSPTQAFPHPLANVRSSNTEPNITNFLSYALVEMMTWQGLGDLVNQLRERTLALEPLSSVFAPGLISRVKVPHTYCWSPALIPKPQDWGSQIDIAGFYFLSLASSYTPPPELTSFLNAGPPPVYIGFGSIVVPDPTGLTNMILEAIRISGARALVSIGWGGIGGEELDVPEGTMLLGNCPHDWLFPRCGAVVHHGGAGTTAAGISSGKPTVVVPFFGDQPFWGAMIARAGAGPEPVPYTDLTAEILAESITKALAPETVERAKQLGASIRGESGVEEGARSFHRALARLPDGPPRCAVFADRSPVWEYQDIKLSSLAAAALVKNNAIKDYDRLKLHRHKEWYTDEGPWDPITGATGALMGTVGGVLMGVADIPMEPFRMFSKSRQKSEASEKAKGKQIYENQGAVGSTASLKPTASTTSISPQPSNPPSSAVAPDRPPPPRSSSNTGQHEEKWGATETIDAINSTMFGTRRIVGAGLKSPMDLTLGLAQGFRNAPRLYGDDTVRQQEKITGFGSGLKTAGKEFGYGLYDGIGGLVTQPIRGAQKEGAAGFFKGVGKGIGGVVLKTTAGAFGVAAYPMKGLNQAWRNALAPAVDKYVKAARIRQGELELQETGSTLIRVGLANWPSTMAAQKRGKKGKGKTKNTPNTRAERSLSPNVPELDGNCVLPSELHDHQWRDGIQEMLAKAPDAELEEAIRQSVTATSAGNAEEDEAMARALRASLAELQRKPADAESEDEALKRAVKASAVEYIAASANNGKYEGIEEEEQLAEAMKLSLGLGGTPPIHELPVDEDEEMKRAIQESLRAHQHQQSQEPPGLDRSSEHTPVLVRTPSASDSDSDSPWDASDGEEPATLLKAPTKRHTFGPGAGRKLRTAQQEIETAPDMHQEEVGDEEEQYRRALAESLAAQEEDERKRQEKEEIVLRYVMEQSAQEEELRRSNPWATGSNT